MSYEKHSPHILLAFSVQALLYCFVSLKRLLT